MRTVLIIALFAALAVVAQCNVVKQKHGIEVVVEGMMLNAVLAPVGHTTITSTVVKATKATAAKTCPTGTHKSWGDCAGNTEWCNTYDEENHDCKDCKWYAFKVKHQDNGDYCATRWWAILLGMLVVLFLLGLLGVVMMLAKKKPVEEELPILPKSEMTKVQRPVEHIKESSPPPQQEVVYVHEPEHVTYVNEPVTRYYQEPARVVYGEPRYTMGSSNVRTSNVAHAPGERYLADTRTYSPERVTYSQSRTYDQGHYDPRTYGSRVVYQDAQPVLGQHQGHVVYHGEQHHE